MVLPTPTWKRLPTQSVAAPQGIDDVLDAIYNALASVTYYDGSGRTPGSGQAWTATREISGVTVSVRAFPPSASVSDLGAIIAGLSGAATPVMRSPDTYLADQVLVGIFRDVPGSPTFNGWDNATPITSANFSGYIRSGNAASTPYSNVIVFEFDECLFIVLEGAAANWFIQLGAAIEPGQADEGDVNGRIYGMMAGGSLQIGTAFNNLAPGASQGFWSHNAVNNFCHAFVFDPFTPGTAMETVNAMTVDQPLTTLNRLGPNGSIIGDNILLSYASGTYSGYAAGYLRGVVRINDQTGCPVIRSAGVDQAYVASATPGAANDAIAVIA